MALQVGRNAPCPCGSGKKYKKCCLAADLAQMTNAARAPQTRSDLIDASAKASGLVQRQEFLRESPRPPPVPLSPEEQRWERFWEKFRSAPFEQRLEQARAVITTEADVDEELAFDLAEGVVFPAQRAGRLDEADAFLDLLVSRHPAAAAKQAAWIAMLRTENALLRPSIPGARKSNRAQSSPMWFCTGVPVRARRCSARSRRAALLVRLT